MAKTNLGRVMLIPRGEYSASTPYEKLDVVTYQGSSYVCKVACSGVAPTDTSKWQLMAEKGGKGDKGDQGIQGLQGIAGPSGAHVDDLVIEQTTGSATDKVMSQKAVSDGLGQLAQQVEEIGSRPSGGGGLPSAAKLLLLTILRKGIYDEDVTELIKNLEESFTTIESITLSRTSITFNGNGTQQLYAITVPDGALVYWNSTNRDVADVDNNGLVTAVNNGSCRISASAGDKSASCSVSVSGVLPQYRIINNLTNVTNNNSATKISEGSTYSAKLTAEADHVIKSYSVKMGGTDITSTAYSKGNINITNVSGNIEITAVAEVGVANLFDNAVFKEGYGVHYTAKVPRLDSNYSCGVIPVELGKLYQIENFDWGEKGGANNAFGATLCYKDGDEYIALSGSDFVSGNIFSQRWTNVVATNNIGKNTINSLPIYFETPTSDLLVNPSKQMYLLLNVRFLGVDVRNEVEIYPYILKAVDNGERNETKILINCGIHYKNKIFQYDSQYKCYIVQLEWGAKYKVTNFNYPTVSSTARMGLLLKNSNSIVPYRSLLNTDVKNSYMDSDSFFEHTDYIQTLLDTTISEFIFTVPSKADMITNANEIILGFNVAFGGDNLATFNIEKIG